MAANRFYTYAGRFIAACIAVTGLMASEHHGVVKSGGIPLPGATVTAIQGDNKTVTTTDDEGVYSFPALADGVWTMTVEMLGFAKGTRDIGVAPDAPSPEWDLKLMSAAEIKDAVAAALAPPAATPAPTQTAAAPAPAAGTPATPATAEAPKPSTPPTTAPVTAANQAAGRPAAAGGRGAGGANGRPSIRAANQGGGYQRANVNASAGANGQQLPGDQGLTNSDVAFGDINQSSNDAVVVDGSVSNGLGMPGGMNDWGGGRGGDMGMIGGPGGMMGMGPGGIGGDGMNAGGIGGDAAGAGAIGGRGGRGGGGGGFAGGGMPGGFGGGRGGGGFGGGRGGGGGGRNGFAGGGRAGLNSFGNGRRNPRSRYNANLNITETNSALNARPYSLTGQNTAKASTNRTGVSTTVGGPLKIPHVLSGQKTTFTFTYQLTRGRTGNNATSLMPNDALRSGDFSQAVNSLGQPVSIYDPLNGQLFPGNVIPANRISSQAVGLLKYYPEPNFTPLGTSLYNYQIAIPGHSSQDNINTRISETINSKHQVAGNFALQRGTSNNTSVFGFTSATQTNAYNAGLNWQFRPTTRVINRLSYTFSRGVTNLTPYFANRTGGNISGALGITGNDQDPNYWGPPSLSFNNGFAGLSDGSTSRNHSQTGSIGDSVTWIHGLHNFSFGGDFRRQQFNYLNESNARGSFTFTGGMTGLLTNGVAAANTGYDLADFLLGLPDTSKIAFGNADKYLRASWLDAYAQDDWRISNRLSLIIGLRWEYQVPTTELYGRLVNLNIGPYFTTASSVCGASINGCTAASSIGLPSALVHGNPREFQPQFGAAWRPTAKGSGVLRFGYSMRYNTSVYQGLAYPNLTQQSPLSYSLIDSSSIANPLTLSNGFPVQTLSPISTYAVDPNFRLGYVNAWQVSFQHNLPAAMVGTLTYNGAKGTHQMQEIIPNSVAPGAKSSPYPSNYYYYESNGNSISNSMMAQLSRRFRSGFSGGANYLFSKALDNVGTAGGGGRGGAPSGGGSALVAQDWTDLAAERARSAGIRTHTLTGNMQYSTGMGAKAGGLLSGWKGVLLKGWNLMTTVSLGSGAPLTPSLSRSALGGTGIIGPLRPFYTGQPLYNAGGTLNPSAFTQPLSGFYGNAGRNILTGPIAFSMNANASRVFRLGERHSLDFQVQSMNPLNHPTVGGWNTTVGSQQYGIVQNMSAMRSVSTSLRFRF